MGVEWLSISGAIAEVMQLYLLAHHSKNGFVAGFIASILWMTYTVTTAQALGMFIIAPVGIVLNIMGYVKWSKRESQQ